MTLSVGRNVVMLTLLGGLGLVPRAVAQDRLPNSTEKLAVVRDNASLFTTTAVEAVEAELSRASHNSSVPTTIEVIDSLQGRRINDVLLDHAKRANRAGLYVLLVKEQKRIDVRASESYESKIGETSIREIREAFVDGLRRGDPDAGLREGVRAIEKALARISPEKPRTPTTDGQLQAGDASSPLVVRRQVNLTLAGARVVLAAAERKADELKVKVNIWVVDDGGHPLTFARMDGARPASAYTSNTKAFTAATLRQPTGPLPAGATPIDVHLNLSLQNAAVAGGGRLTTLLGGVPIIVDGQVIGAIGVGGATGEQDATVAKAAVAAFLAELAQGADGKKDEKPTAP
jgi:glc operon protein GlcG